MKFKYDWSFEPKVYELLIKLYKGSSQKLTEYRYSPDYALEFIEDTEEFLYGMKQLFPNYFYKVIGALEKLKGISFVSMREEIEKFVQKRDGYILIDPITVVDNLSYFCPSSRKKISIFQGLASMIFEFKSDKTLAFSDEYNWPIEHKRISLEDIDKDKQFINSGWDLLEEALSQMLAGKVYRFLVADDTSKIKHDNSNFDNQIIIDTVSWSFTNDIATFNDLMIRFGITISGISIMNECSEEVVKCRIFIKALKGNFAELAIEDYQRRGQEAQLYHILYDMGELYQNRKLGNQIKLVNDSYTKEIYNDLLSMLSKMMVLDGGEESDTANLNEDSKTKENKCKVRALVNINDKPTFSND